MSAARRAPSTAESTPAEVEAAEKFIADLLARGEAVEQNDATDDEELPPGATHEVVHRDGEAPAVKRRRYSAF